MTQPSCVFTKTFFRANSAELQWSPQGRSCICIVRTDNDQSNQSYYGESFLYFYDSKTSENVELDIKSPIHSAAFNMTSGFNASGVKGQTKGGKQQGSFGGEL
ncbi:MAG: hypothetical protein EZS28_029450, partial [Streblomastix strix]